MEISISNYRAVRHDEPVTLTFDSGITFLLGQNNVGKSSMLRMLSELREVFLRPVDMRRSEEFSSVSTARWDSLSHRDSPNQPLTITITLGRSKWMYVVRPRDPQYGTDLSVSFKPLQYAEENDAAITAGRILTSSIYFGPLRSPAYSSIISFQHSPATGSNFTSRWSEWCSGENVAHRVAANQLEQEIQQLFGFERFKLRPNHNRNELLVDYDEGSFKITELGEGLAHFIVVLGNALIQQPSYVFIDEPENGLHPRLQATFVQILARKASRGLVASSHSMALARSVADTVLFCTRTSKGGLRIGDHQNVELHDVIGELREMSYSQHIESGEQNILLVEGRTDIKAYREILHHYGIDQRFIILPLGGGSFVQSSAEKFASELEGIKAIGAKSVSVIIDSERQNAGAPLSVRHEAFRRLCEKLEFRLHILERRALENYMTEQAVNSLFGANAHALGSFDKIPTSSGWKKARNWQLISRMNRADLESTDLGKFVQEALVPLARF